MAMLLIAALLLMPIMNHAECFTASHGDSIDFKRHTKSEDICNDDLNDYDHVIYIDPTTSGNSSCNFAS